MRKVLLILLITIALGGCSKLRPYRVDIQQGNVIDSSAVAQLHPGLSKAEVSSILGTPLLGDVFNPNVWTYVYTKQINGGKIEKKKLTLEFKQNRLVQIN